VSFHRHASNPKYCTHACYVKHRQRR
jgi:hypothetical protein